MKNLNMRNCVGKISTKLLMMYLILEQADFIRPLTPTVVLDADINEKREFIRLVCISHVKPFSTTFFADNDLKEYIRTSCSGMKGLMCHNCVTTCNDTRKMLSIPLSGYDSGTHTFGCRMRYEGSNFESPLEVLRTIIFNGTAFQQLSQYVEQKDTNIRKPDTETLSFAITVYVPGVILLIVIAVVAFMCFNGYRNRKNKYIIQSEQKEELAKKDRII